MNKNIPDYIVVEGPIGVGKTSLAKQLGDTFNVEVILESATENPFLPAFYENRRSSALPVQLHFLFQRARQIEDLLQTDMFRPVHIADFLIEKDRMFAKVNLSDAEYDLYQQVYERLITKCPSPDLVIYLQAKPEILLSRVLERGIEYERNIDIGYLKRISDAYIDFFYHYNASPLLIINTENFDLVNGRENYNILVEYISKLPPGRHYFNPQGL